MWTPWAQTLLETQLVGSSLLIGDPGGEMISEYFALRSSDKREKLEFGSCVWLYFSRIFLLLAFCFSRANAPNVTRLLFSHFFMSVSFVFPVLFR